jgi:IS30 family transposase
VIRLTPQEREQARAMKRDGRSFDEIARELACSSRTIRRVVYGRRKRPPSSSSWSPGEHRLSLQDREEISRGLVAGESLREIARRLGRAPSSVSREVRRGGGRARYRAVKAHHGAYERARRPKRHKLAAGRLCDHVSARLEELWSPEEIASRLRIEFPDDVEMRVSHETIYQSLYVQGRGELRRELSRCLRTGRANRRSRNRVKNQGKIPGMVMISERPAEVADRAVPGHWEGDLILGKLCRSAVGTLVARTTRFVLLLHLP